jgi:nucleotide-binding universal stress UspA family protein
VNHLLFIAATIVAVDSSEESFRAIEFALVLAKRFDSSVQLLFVYKGKPPFSAGEGRPELFLDPAVELFSEREIGERLKDEMKRKFSIGTVLVLMTVN